MSMRTYYCDQRSQFTWEPTFNSLSLHAPLELLQAVRIQGATITEEIEYTRNGLLCSSTEFLRARDSRYKEDIPPSESATYNKAANTVLIIIKTGFELKPTCTDRLIKRIRENPNVTLLTGLVTTAALGIMIAMIGSMYPNS